MGRRSLGSPGRTGLHLGAWALAALFVECGQVEQGRCPLRLLVPPHCPHPRAPPVSPHPQVRLLPHGCNRVFASSSPPAVFCVLGRLWSGNSAHTNSLFQTVVQRRPELGQGCSTLGSGGRPPETVRNGASPAPHVAGIVTGSQGPEQQVPPGATAALPPFWPFASDPRGGLEGPHGKTVWRPRAHGGSCSNEKSEN